MRGRSRGSSSHQRRILAAGWSLCETEPGACAKPADVDESRWRGIARLGTVAAALRDAGAWSLDGDARRLDAQDWWYRLHFAGLPAAHGVRDVLGFDGIASVADVWLNGELLLSSDNMFVAHECALGDRLRADNSLVIRCRSLDALLAERRARPRWRATMVENQQLRWFRTSLLGRTPGWSPPAAPVGPWRDIWLERRERFDLTALHTRARVDGDAGVVELRCVARPLGDAPIASMTLVVRAAGHTHRAMLERQGSSDEFRAALRIPGVRLWWPHTHGEPHLYDAAIEVACKGVGEPLGADLGRIGFRTLALDTTDGGFAIAVNGVKVFCRGACWTPLDPVSLRATPEQYRAAIGQAREAGMNMLRLSGALVDEADAFLDECDAQGMLVWQEFMFANMDYPADAPAFAQAVEAEARQLLARLQARPCVAVVCGNSEVEQQAAMWGAARELWQPALFHETLAALSREALADVPYWPSSAHGGAFPHQASAGTTSYYGLGAYLRPPGDARRAGLRFATECLAFANVPEAETIARMPGGPGLRTHHPQWKARTPRDLGAGWDFEDVRDHYLRELYALDPHRLRATEPERYLALARTVPGELMTEAFSEWRSGGSPCGGALVWFLRDLWAGAGWGIVDDQGLPKAGYHYLKRLLQPVALFITDEGGNGLMLHAVNERASPVVGELTLRAYRESALVASAARKLTLASRGVLGLSLGELFDGFLDLSYAYRFGAPVCDLVVASLHTETAEAIEPAVHFPIGRPSGVNAQLGLSALATPGGEGEVRVKVAAREFAQAVQVQLEGYAPDQAYFHLPPLDERWVTLRPLPGHPRPATRGQVQALNASVPTHFEVLQ